MSHPRVEHPPDHQAGHFAISATEVFSETIDDQYGYDEPCLRREEHTHPVHYPPQSASHTFHANESLVNKSVHGELARSLAQRLLLSQALIDDVSFQPEQGSSRGASKPSAIEIDDAPRCPPLAHPPSRPSTGNHRSRTDAMLSPYTMSSTRPTSARSAASSCGISTARVSLTSAVGEVTPILFNDNTLHNWSPKPPSSLPQPSRTIPQTSYAVHWGPSSVRQQSTTQMSRSALTVPAWKRRFALSRGPNRTPRDAMLAASSARVMLEAPRLYDSLDREELRLAHAALVPMWYLDHIERIQIGKDEEDIDALWNKRHRLLSWHHHFAVASVVVIQLFLKEKISAMLARRRRHRRDVRLKQPPPLDSVLDATLDELEYRVTLANEQKSKGSPMPAITDTEAPLTSVSNKRSPLHKPAPPSSKKRVANMQLALCFTPRYHDKIYSNKSSSAKKKSTSPPKERSPRDQSHSFGIRKEESRPTSPLGDSVGSISLSRPGPEAATSSVARGSSFATLRKKKSSSSLNSNLASATSTVLQFPENPLKENAASVIFRFFSVVPARWRLFQRQRNIAAMIEETKVREHLLVIQMYLIVKRSKVIYDFKLRQQKRNRAASVIQRIFRFRYYRRKFKNTLAKFNEWNNKRIHVEQQRDACRTIFSHLQCIRAKNIVSKRKKLLHMKMQYREETEKRQRANELIAMLSKYLTCIVRRVKKAHAAHKNIERRVQVEKEKERKIKQQELAPLIQAFLRVRKAKVIQRTRELQKIALLQKQLTERKNFFSRYVMEACSKAMQQRVQMAALLFLERCPSLWILRLKQRKAEFTRKLHCRMERASVIQAFLRAKKSAKVVLQKRSERENANISKSTS